MEQISRDNQYHVFYQNLRDFMLGINLAAPSDIEGATEEEIIGFEKKHNLSLPSAFRVYLKYFGKKVSIKRESFMYFFTLGKLAYTMTNVYRLNPKLVVQKKGYLNDTDSSYADILVPLTNFISIEDIVFILWEGTRPSFTFIDSSVNNPTMFYLMDYSGGDYLDDCTIETEFRTFTTSLRNNLFVAIASKFYDTDYSSYTPENDQYYYEIGQILSSINLNHVDWAKLYTKIYKDRLIDGGTILGHRFVFYTIIGEKEKQEDRLLSIDEFEWAFIAYLQEQGYDV